MHIDEAWRARWERASGSSTETDDAPRLNAADERSLDEIRHQLDEDYGAPLARRESRKANGWHVAERGEVSWLASRRAAGALGPGPRRMWAVGAALVAGCAMATFVLTLLSRPASPPDAIHYKPATPAPANTRPEPPLTPAPTQSAPRPAAVSEQPAAAPQAAPSAVVPAPTPAAPAPNGSTPEPAVPTPRASTPEPATSGAAPAGAPPPATTAPAALPPRPPAVTKPDSSEPGSGAPVRPAVKRQPTKPRPQSPVDEPVPAPRRFSAQPATIGAAPATSPTGSGSKAGTAGRSMRAAGGSPNGAASKPATADATSKATSAPPIRPAPP